MVTRQRRPLTSIVLALVAGTLLPSVALAQTPPPPPQEVTLIAVGDVMLSRGVAKQMKAKKDLNFPFLKMTDYLKSADITFGNLECPITKGPDVKSGTMVFHAHPGVEVALKDAGFNMLSLANNHLPDWGTKGVTDTVAFLDAVGIANSGAGKDSDAAEKPALITKKDIRFAFLSYNDQDVVPKRYGAAKDRPGTNIMDLEKVTKAVQAAKQQADLVIVSMHSGWEYKKPNPQQAAFAKAAIDAGAELVIGHHPHVVQRIEKYKGKFILYSLGNFVFDQTWAPYVKQGMAVKVTFTKSGLKGMKFTPVLIEQAAQPREITEPKLREKVLAKLEWPLTEDGTAVLDPPVAAIEKR